MEHTIGTIVEHRQERREAALLTLSSFFPRLGQAAAQLRQGERSWRTLLHSRLPCVGQPSSSMLRVGAPALVPVAPWLGDYPAARADAGVAHGAAAARGHA